MQTIMVEFNPVGDKAYFNTRTGGACPHRLGKMVRRQAGAYAEQLVQ